MHPTNNKKTSVVLIIPSLKAGGMERVMTELANYFATHTNLFVHLIMFGKSPLVFYDIDSHVVIHKPESEFNDRIRLLETIRRIVFIRRKIKQINPDSILSFGIHWNNFVLLSLKGLGYPIFVSDRGNPERSYLAIHEFLRRILYKSASGIIAQTAIAKEITFKILPKSRIEIIGNPIRIIDSNNIVLKENIILSVGRLINTKHHDRLIHIYSKLNAPDWKLLIVGGNALKQKNSEKLKQLITELGLQDRVFLTGEQKNVDEYYLKSKIFAFCSSVEGFPNVVGEALSAGLPVISYDCVAGPSEMIKDGENGFLVPVFDDCLFQQKLQLLIDNKDLQLKFSENAKVSIKEFSIENIGNKYYSFITSLE